KNTIHPVSLKNIRKFLPEFYENQMPHKSMVFLQYVKPIGETNYSPFITFTKTPKLRNGLVIRLPVRTGEFGTASKKMEQIVEMDQFKMKNFKRFQTLTNRELEILKLLANGYKNLHIAEKLFISRQTVETHRKNLKRKLEIRSYRDLVKYAFAFNLITF
ncbi:MAG: helix-turn-helix transcriptional regulator, partial [Balneolaceae bacterium]